MVLNFTPVELRADAQMFDVYDDKSIFLMRCPIGTIRTVWSLHQRAVDAVLQETKADGICQLHANGKPRLGGEFIIIQPAVGER